MILKTLFATCHLALLPGKPSKLYREVRIDGIVYRVERYIGTAAGNDMLVLMAGSPMTLALKVLEY